MSLFTDPLDGNRKELNIHNANAKDRWIKWEGTGDCPVDPELFVYVRYRDGDEAKHKAKSLLWKHVKSSYDIMAYRVPV